MILHVDMDAFYASIEIRDRPELKDKPVIVGGSPTGRGVVAAASYKAREYGIHSAMPASRARGLCPEAVFLPSRIAYYSQISEQIHAIFKRYTPLVEPLSLDEAFLDVTQSEALFGGAEAIGRRIKKEIREETGLIASVGVAPSKFVSKIASDIGKPDGFVVVPEAGIRAFLDPLPVRRLWGVGKVTDRILEKAGIRTIRQFRDQPRRMLHDLLGKWGDHLWELARGIDPRPVVPDHEAKSISHEVTFEADRKGFDDLHKHLVEMVEHVAARLRRHGLRARTVEIKIRFPDFKTITRSRTLPGATDLTGDLIRIAALLLEKHLPRKHAGVRLLGMGVSHLDSGEPSQGELFADDRAVKQSRMDAASDRIRDKFGDAALRRGAADRPRPARSFRGHPT
jgi:DNA polymerase IV